MDIILTKDTETRTLKPGSALYLLLRFIPIVGGVIVLIMTLIKKQFRGTILNEILLAMICTVVIIVVPFIFTFISLKFATFLVSIGLVALVIFVVYVYIHLIINANRYSLAQYLKDGYKIENMDYLNEATKLWIEESKDKERAKFLFLEF